MRFMIKSVHCSAHRLLRTVSGVFRPGRFPINLLKQLSFLRINVFIIISVLIRLPYCVRLCPIYGRDGLFQAPRRLRCKPCGCLQGISLVHSDKSVKNRCLRLLRKSGWEKRKSCRYMPLMRRSGEMSSALRLLLGGILIVRRLH